MKFGRARIDAGFVLLLSVLVYLDQGRLLWVALAAALLHELGHFLALKACGGRVAALSLSAGGLGMEPAPLPRLSYGREFCTVLAGPAASLAGAALFSHGFVYLPLAGMCLVQGGFNLLPVAGLDGGRLLSVLLESRGVRYAEWILGVVSAVFLTALTALGAVQLWSTGGNASLLLAALYAAGAGFGGKRMKRLPNEKLNVEK